MKSRHSINAWLTSLCATTVAVAIWIVVVVLNLLHWLFGDAAFVRPLAWAILVVSAVAFQWLFYRHFSKAQAS